MCGIAGLWSADGVREESLRSFACGMAEVLTYRGPDGSGVWVDETTGLALGHRRLSIIDLTQEGHQPMVSPGGRYVISYNGEVYNFRELRRELETLGYGFRGHSDTEVMLAAFEAWGLEPAVRRFVGMFAVALWDRQKRQLFLVRDRLGIKPLYYGWCGSTFLFGSELKALRVYPGFNAEIDRDALCLYLRHNYIPTPYTIYKGIYKLLPGHILTVPQATAGASGVRDYAYWSIRQAADAGMSNRFSSDTEAMQALEETLMQAVRSRMISDVPLGAFLSGGVDSSTVVALMQAQSSRPVKTFSIGFEESKYNEATHARRVAEHLGTNHTELYVTPADAMAVIPMLPQMFNEPFADSSQIPTYLVSKLARSAVTVSLSGDGGDELFAGYDRYFRTLEVWRKIGWMPAAGRRALGTFLERGPGGMLQAASMLGSGIRGETITPDRLRKLGGMLATASPQSLYREFLSHWRRPTEVVMDGEEPDYILAREDDWRVSPDNVENMCFADLNSYLPDDILTKVDRASMAVSLEARVPVLDHRVVELAWRVPMKMKIRNGQSKWLLRQVLYKHVPPELIERPKMGFGVPIDEWLRGSLRDWAESLLSEGRLRREGFFNPAPIRTKWREHLSGTRRWHYYLWDVLMFQAWWEQQADFASGCPTHHVLAAAAN